MPCIIHPYHLISLTYCSLSSPYPLPLIRLSLSLSLSPLNPFNPHVLTYLEIPKPISLSLSVRSLPNSDSKGKALYMLLKPSYEGVPLLLTSFPYYQHKTGNRPHQFQGSLSGSLPHSAMEKVLAATQLKLSDWEIDRRMLRIGEIIASGSCGAL